MAQAVEHVLGKDEVTGSNPVLSSKAPKAVAFGALLIHFFPVRRVVAPYKTAIGMM